MNLFKAQGFGRRIKVRRLNDISLIVNLDVAEVAEFARVRGREREYGYWIHILWIMYAYVVPNIIDVGTGIAEERHIWGGYS